MDNLQRAQTLDRVLKFLIDNDHGVTIGEISEKFQLEFPVMYALINEITGDGFATGRNIMPSRPEFRGDSMVQISPQGRYFILQGGYTAQWKLEQSQKQREQKSRRLEKLYAIVLLIFTGATAIESYHTITTDHQVKRLNSELNGIRNEVDTLKNEKQRLEEKILLLPDSIRDEYFNGLQ